MTYSYRILSPGLAETADSAISWFVKKWGLKKSKIQVEAAFDPDVNFRPTFVVPLDDGHLLCLDVSQHIYSPTLDSVALACLRKALPVKLYTVVPRDSADPDYSRKLKAAKLAGVGVFEVNSNSGTIVQSAISLSLGGLRPLDVSSFPPKYRQPLQHADQTFRDGEPSKACSMVYDELESYVRVFAKKCIAKGFLTVRRLNPDRAAWSSLVDEIDRGIDRGNQSLRKVTPALLARIKGVTSHRNESGHKPTDLKTRIKRDSVLRTRFESGVDLLLEFVEATKSFRI